MRKRLVDIPVETGGPLSFQACGKALGETVDREKSRKNPSLRARRLRDSCFQKLSPATKELGGVSSLEQGRVVDHEATGKATYCNCNVIGLEYFNGVASVHDSEWKGSAEDYVPGHPEAKFLYAWKVARKSNSDPHCLEVPTGPSHYGIGLDERIWLFFRVYLERATRVGPAWNELVFDRVIKFSPKR